MQNITVVGYTHNGEFYCSVDCLPGNLTADDDSVSPVFAGDEWDEYPTCGGCSETCEDVSVTSDEDDWRDNPDDEICE